MQLNQWTSEQRGRAQQLARVLQVTPPVVSDWCTGKKQVPFEQCVLIEQATEGVVSCEELRPDKTSDFAYLRNRAPRPVEPPVGEASPVADAPIVDFRRADGTVVKGPDPRRRSERLVEVAGLTLVDRRRSAEQPSAQQAA